MSKFEPVNRIIISAMMMCPLISKPSYIPFRKINLSLNQDLKLRKNLLDKSIFLFIFFLSIFLTITFEIITKYEKNNTIKNTMVAFKIKVMLL